MFVVRKLLSPREGATADTRYNPDCDCMETSTDGGETWNENVGADPRVNPAYIMPPNIAPDVRCAAAAGMLEDVRRVVNAGISGGGVVGIGTLLIAFLVLPLGLLWLMIATIAAAISGLGGFALNAAFTEEVYEFLLCKFYENTDAEGRIDAAGYAAVQSAAAGEFSDSVIDTLLSAVWTLHGAIGLSNAGVIYADPDAECACANWCYTVDLTAVDGGFSFTDSGSWSAGVGLIATDTFVGVNRTLLMGEFIFGEELPIVSIDMVYDYFPATTTPATEGTGIWSNYFENPMWSYDQNVAPQGADLHANVISSAIPETLNGISVYFQAAYNAHGGTAVIKTVQLTGTGEPPAWFASNGWDEC